jgi:hypothetical protein
MDRKQGGGKNLELNFRSLYSCAPSRTAKSGDGLELRGRCERSVGSGGSVQHAIITGDESDCHEVAVAHACRLLRSIIFSTALSNS